MPPLWVLSVDLQAKTATFATGMGDAAKGAKGAFRDIETGAGEMGHEVGYNMSEARHGVMLLGESLESIFPVRSLALLPVWDPWARLWRRPSPSWLSQWAQRCSLSTR